MVLIWKYSFDSHSVIGGDVSTANCRGGLHDVMMSICCGTISSNVAASDYYFTETTVNLYLLCFVGTFTHSSRVPIDSLIIREVRCSAKLILVILNVLIYLILSVCLLVCLYFSYVAVCFHFTVVKREKCFTKWTWEYILCGRFQTIAKKWYFFSAARISCRFCCS